MENKEMYSSPYWWLWLLLKKWKFIVVTSMVVGILAIGIAFILPKWYRAEAEIMPQMRSTGGMGAMANLVTGIMSMGGGGGEYSLPMMTTPSDLWAGLIESNAIVDTIAEEFHLADRYGIRHRERWRKAVKSHMEAEVTGEGILKISFEDKNPEFAAMVANSIVDYLNGINRDLRATSAGATREFVEKRLAETEIGLHQAESLFAEFQKENKAISLEDQTKVTIESAAQLKAELLIAEVEMGILSTSKKKSHNDVESMQSRIDELKKQIKEIQTGEWSDMSPGLDEIPDLAIEYARLFRNLTIQEVLYEYLVQQYEQSKIEEKRDTPVLQILSRAKVPQKKDRPKRLVIGILSGLAAIILLSLWVLGHGGLEKIRTNSPNRYKEMAKYLGERERKTTEE